MSGNNRFHNKFHRADHHSQATPGIPGSGTDPIASSQYPFIGDFNLTGTLSARNNLFGSVGTFSTINTQILSAASYIYGNVTPALCAANIVVDLNTFTFEYNGGQNIVVNGAQYMFLNADTCVVGEGGHSAIINSTSCRAYGEGQTIIGGINVFLEGEYCAAIGVENLSATDSKTVFVNKLCAVQINSYGTAAIVAAGAGAGAGASTTITGNNIRGQVTIITNSAPVANNTLALVTYDQQYMHSPIVVLTPANAPACSYTPYVSSNISRFAITSNATTPSAFAVYQYNYHVIG